MSHTFSRVNSVKKITPALNRALKFFRALGENKYSPDIMNKRHVHQLDRGRAIWELVKNTGNGEHKDDILPLITAT